MRGGPVRGARDVSRPRPPQDRGVCNMSGLLKLDNALRTKVTARAAAHHNTTQHNATQHAASHPLPAGPPGSHPPPLTSSSPPLDPGRLHAWFDLIMILPSTVVRGWPGPASAGESCRLSPSSPPAA